MHQNAFGGRAPPGPTGELERSTRPLAAVRGGKGKGRRGGKRKKRQKKGRRDGKSKERGKGKKRRGGKGELSISLPNFDEISQSTAEIKLLPVSENGRPPF